MEYNKITLKRRQPVGIQVLLVVPPVLLLEMWQNTCDHVAWCGFYHITSLPGREKSHITVSCFSTWLPTTAQETCWGSRVRPERVRPQPSCYLLPGCPLLCASPHSGASPSPRHHPGLSPFLCPEAELLQGRLTSHLQPTRPDTEPRAF